MRKNIIIYFNIAIIAGMLSFILMTQPSSKQEIKALKNQNDYLKLTNDSLNKYIDSLLKENIFIKKQSAVQDSLIQASEKLENDLLKAIINIDNKYRYEKNKPVHNTINDKLNYIRAELL